MRSAFRAISCATSIISNIAPYIWDSPALKCESFFMLQASVNIDSILTVELNSVVEKVDSERSGFD